MYLSQQPHTTRKVLASASHQSVFIKRYPNKPEALPHNKMAASSIMVGASIPGAAFKAQPKCRLTSTKVWHATARSAAPQQQRRVTSANALAEPRTSHLASVDETYDVRETLACFLQGDGTLVSEELSPGRYEVRAALPTWEGRAFCSLDNPEECVTYCSINEDGSLVCEGLREGVYTVRTASDSDVARMVETIWLLTSMNEEDDL